MQAADNVLLVDGALFEELLHQSVVAFGNRLDQLLVRCLGFSLHVVGNRPDFGLAVAAHLVGVGLHLDQVDHAGEIFLRADRQLHGNHHASEAVGQRLHYAREVGAFAVHAGADDGARQRKSIGIVPDALGHDFDAADCVDHDQTPSSTAGSTISASWMNMLKPGVSMRLILVLPHSTTAVAADSDMARDISSSS